MNRLREKTTATLLIATFMISALAVVVQVMANTVESSTMGFEGTLTPDGDGYTGIIPMIVGGGYDIYAKEGASAWFGNDPGSGPVWTEVTIADHDAWPTWDPDTPDWYQYSLDLYKDGDVYKWAVRNHPSATEANPWYDEAHWGAGGKPPCGVPMSGIIVWRGDGTGYALETDVGAYLPTTGIPEILGGAASKGDCAGAWDMDWSWGSEYVPLEYPGFRLVITPTIDGYKVTLTPSGITIQDGILLNSNGGVITTGFDEWGYNYQSHMFNGWYWNNARPEVPWTEETLIAAGKSTTRLIMKWNDVWLSNMDRNGDGKLDRGIGPNYASSGVPGAWETNHQFGSYEDDGKKYKWNYYVKIVCAPEDAYKDGGIWYLEDGTEMGTVIWGAYARTLQVYNDQGTGEHGVEYNPEAPTGFGCYK